MADPRGHGFNRVDCKWYGGYQAQKRNVPQIIAINGWEFVYWHPETAMPVYERDGIKLMREPRGIWWLTQVGNEQPVCWDNYTLDEITQELDKRLEAA